MLNTALARRRRRWLDLTQEEVAARIGVAEQTLSLWETGKREPTLENAVAWAKALGLELADLLPDSDADQVGVGEADAPPAPVPVPAGGAGADGHPSASATPPQSDARRSA